MLMTSFMEPIQSNSIFQIIDTPIRKSRLRSSPPPVVSVSIESDDDDETKVEDQRNNLLSRHRPSLPLAYPGYYRKKSHSVKLTRHDGTDSCPKKAVRFADDFGLELSQMRMINTDELPFIPNEAFKYLHVNHECHTPPQERMKVIAYMEPQFENPLYSENFNERVCRQKIVLEQANAINNRIYGSVRLVSLGLHKRVKIRLTTDNWISFRDYDATYINNSYDGLCDRFSFTIEVDRDRICVGNTIQFCICYESFGGPEYWDNNSQQNYRLNCLSRTIPDYSLNQIF